MSLWGFKMPQMYITIFILCSYLFIYSANLGVRPKVSRLKGIYRIGPHNIDVISVIFGSLLGDAHAEKRASGTRICFFQEANHSSYLLYLHNFFSNLGYCNPKIPDITTRLGVKGKTRQIVRFSTWTYTSFNWIYDLFYAGRTKCVPSCIDEYLTPLALAVWIMDDGAKVHKGLKLSTNSFTFNECLILIKALNDNFNLKASIQSAGASNQYIIYIWKESMDDLRYIVSPYIIPEMKYKLNID